MPSDQQPDRLRLVVDPDQRPDERSGRHLDTGEQRRDSRQEPKLGPGRPPLAMDPDEDLRIHPLGGADPLDDLGDDDEEDTTANPEIDQDGHAHESPQGRWLPITTAVLALLGFGAIVWYAYQWGAASAPEELPVIRAETEPSKIRPESPGGLDVPYQETLALNDLQPDPAKPQVERLLPPPETPAPPPVAEATPVPAGAATETAPGTAPETPAAEATPPKAGDETETAAAPVEVPARPLVPAVPTAPAAPTAPTQAAAPSGGFVLQLASLKAQEGAAIEWTRLQKSFPDLLGGRQLVVVPVNLGDRGTYYRVHAGYFSDRPSAIAVCEQLKAKSQDCLVTKR